jgi:acyl-CoA synthetase (AMP-forming)/AMP-acid ligase II
MSFAPRREPARQGLPLIGARDAQALVAYRRGAAITAARFLADVSQAAEALPEARHVLNACADRYRFAVVLCATIVRGKVTLLPPSTTPNVIAALRAFAPDAVYATDDASVRLDLPRVDLPEPGSDPGVGPRGQTPEAQGVVAIPMIAADQVVACVFTSGSTGEPQPNFKTWGGLVRDVMAEARRLEIGAGHSILGTVPPQHMYGFESTVLLPLVSGAALTSERPYFPADIDAAIARVPAPRTLFITPFHLRTWMESAPCAAIETMVSATAPLSAALAREAEERTGARLMEIYGCTESGQIATRRTAKTAEWQAFDGLRLWTEGTRAMVGGGHVESPTPLQDVIEILGEGERFLLHGRNADMVNVAGKRNSLSYLAHQLMSIEGVKDGVFHLPEEANPDGVTRLMAFAVAPGLDAKAILAALRERVDAAFLPRPLVLVERLPREATGKLTRASLEALAQGVAAQPRAVETRLAFARDHRALEGHFPGRPIVPGVALLAEVLAAVEASTARPPESWKLENAKFLRVVEGGRELALKHELLPTGGVRFEIRAEDELVATGRLAPS